MGRNTNGSRLVGALKMGLEDVIAYKKGKLTLISEEIEIATPPIKIKSQKVKTKLNKSV